MYKNKQYALFIFVVLAWIGSFVGLAWYLIGADMPLMVFAGILILVGFVFHGLTIKVDNTSISWGFGPGLFGDTLLLQDIVEAKAVENSFRHGIGLRITHDGWIYTVSGFSAVQLTMKDGSQYRLGTNDQAGLLAALDGKISPSEAVEAA
ncbi:hypothetical protein [Pseudoalteromonas atlantica]|uniref:hypothetical protein n=1 Tax=Pseudoalteromonas atlantica TaxID=288 RepID=UPI0037369B60